MDSLAVVKYKALPKYWSRNNIRPIHNKILRNKKLVNGLSKETVTGTHKNY